MRRKKADNRSSLLLSLPPELLLNVLLSVLTPNLTDVLLRVRTPYLTDVVRLTHISSVIRQLVLSTSKFFRKLILGLSKKSIAAEKAHYTAFLSSVQSSARMRSRKQTCAATT